MGQPKEGWLFLGPNVAPSEGREISTHKAAGA